MQNIRTWQSLRDSKNWVAPTVTAAGFFVSAMIGLAVSRGTDGIAAFWPSNGILLSALLLTAPPTRWRHVALCVPAGFLANAGSGSPVALATLFSIVNVATAVIAAHIIRKLRSGPEAFETIGGASRFFLAVGIAVLLGATAAATGIAYSGGDFASAWSSWARSDLLGIALITSVILTSASKPYRRSPTISLRQISSSVWPILSVAAASFIVFSQSRLPLLFVPLAALMIATYRVGIVGTVLGTAMIAVIGTGFLASGHGPVSLIVGSVASRVAFFQFYVAVLFGTCLPLASLLSDRARLAQERAESDRRHQRILERSREVIFETDLNGKWTYLSAAWSELTGRPNPSSLGTSFLSVVAPDDRATALEKLGALYRFEIDACHQELRFVHADGGQRVASIVSHLLLDEHGVAVGTYGTIHDGTAHRKAEDARVESERLYKLLADHSNDMIVKLTLEGVRRYVSPASFNLLGFTPEEMLGEAAAGSIHPDDRATAIATCASLLNGVANPICIYRQLHKNGTYVWLEASYRLISDDIGTPIEFIATVRDVGRREEAELERLQASAQLNEANRLLMLAEEMSLVGHWRVDVASRSVFWSDVVCGIYGRPSGCAPTLDEAIEAYHPDDRPTVQQHVDEAFVSGKAFAISARIVRDGGDVRHVISRGRTEQGPDGSVVGMFGVIQDVTEAYEAAVALEAASKRLQEGNRLLTMAESIGKLGHWRIDYEDGTMLWSDEVYRIYDLPRDTPPTAENALAVYHPDDVDRVRENLAACKSGEGEYASQSRIVRGDGTIAHVRTRGEVEFDGHGVATGLFGIVQDITERVEAEAMLQEREARFRLLTEQASDMISLHDEAGQCLFMSPSVRLILGYEPSDVQGQQLNALVSESDYGVIKQLRADLASRPFGEVSTARFRMKRRDASLIWIEAAARIADYQGDARIVVVSRDVSAQVKVEIELEAARSHAEDAAKAKSSFLANMSHEIRTPMNGVIGFTELLLNGDLSSDQRRQAELIADSGRAMMRLLNDILDLSKVEAGQMTVSSEPFDLRHTLIACMKLVTPALEQKGLLPRCEIAEELPRMVCGDGLRLRQILLNLLGNAAKFTQSGFVTLRALPSEDGGLLVEVEDTGIGIAEDRRASIFEQFAQADGTIAARYGGTGLGLSISTQLADLMGGSLGVESQLGIGTTFLLRLPLILAGRSGQPSSDSATGASDPPAAASPTRVRVLVAEDHDVNRMLMSAMLERLGYTCDLAGDGVEAISMIKAARAEGNSYAIVLMDMQMPRMDGLEATRRLRASGLSADDLPIVALTANAYADDISACLGAGMQAHLAKPVALADLDATLSRWAVTPDARVRKPTTGARFKPEVQRRYRARRTETLDALSEMVRRGLFEDAEVEEVAEMLHKLAGTAAMFGEGPLGDAARSLEAGLHSWSLAERPGAVASAFEAIKGVAAG